MASSSRATARICSDRLRARTVRSFRTTTLARCVTSFSGLHYQIRQPQGKLVRVVVGEVFDVVVDLRRHSPTFGKWMGTMLTAENKRLVWIPEGFAHGFLVLSDVGGDYLQDYRLLRAPTRALVAVE